jgi:1-acyl-sn-glycerol-3-phosphate acyltransferase
VSATWYGDQPPPQKLPLGVSGWTRAALKTMVLVPVIFGGLFLLLLVRLLEGPIFRPRRPVTPFITVFVCRVVLRVVGLKVTVVGAFRPATNAVVANHSSWLDIFALNSVKRVYFVSKSEVASWPAIGWLARATGTVFIERDRSKAAAQSAALKERLSAGHMLLFFPEGTSSDGLRLLPFKTSLFSAFFDPALHDSFQIQPASLRYKAPPGQDPRFFGWWGDMEFGPHFLRVLAFGAGGQVIIRYHDPIQVSGFSDRKSLALVCEQAVRRGIASDA